jgi:chromatin segregation and condensation protein Rec8/ScpA/Scc1 (kleisin family)
VPDSFCQLGELQAAMYRVLTALPKAEPKPIAKIRPTITLEDMMEKLKRRIENQIRTKFSEIRATETEHKNVIVSFLAILELFKQGNLIITQANRFDDIHLELDKTSTPRYY